MSVHPPPPPLTPHLSPGKLQLALVGQVLLDGVVHALNEHGLHTHPLKQVGHGGTVAKRVVGPARPWGDTCVMPSLRNANRPRGGEPLA